MEIFDPLQYTDNQMKLIISKLEKIEVIYRLKSIGEEPLQPPRYHLTIK